MQTKLHCRSGVEGELGERHKINHEDVGIRVPGNTDRDDGPRISHSERAGTFVLSGMRMKKEIKGMLVSSVFSLFGIVVLIYSLGSLFEYDNTDDTANRERSGLSLYTDYGTGVQYVKGGIFGGTAIRINRDGLPVNIYTNPVE